MNDPVIATLQRANHGSHFRAIGLRGLGALTNPFLGVDHAWMSAPTFPPHRHAGLSAVSYVFHDAETGITNEDSIGTRNLIQPGGIHWTTAGRGIIHEEVPAQDGKTVHSLQIFVGLSPARADMAPAALTLEPDEVPVVTQPGSVVSIPVGSFAGVRSPLEPPTEVSILDIELEKGAELVLPIASGDCAFLMPIFGTVAIDGQNFDRNDLKLPVFQADESNRETKIQAPYGRVQVMYFAGPPLSFDDR